MPPGAGRAYGPGMGRRVDRLLLVPLGLLAWVACGAPAGGERGQVADDEAPATTAASELGAVGAAGTPGSTAVAGGSADAVSVAAGAGAAAPDDDPHGSRAALAQRELFLAKLAEVDDPETWERADVQGRALIAGLRFAFELGARLPWDPRQVHLDVADGESVDRHLLHTTGRLVRDRTAGGVLRLPDDGVVALVRAPTGSPDSGVLMLGLRAGPVHDGRPRVLLDWAGAPSLDGDRFADLIVGGAAPDDGPAWSHVYFGAPGGPRQPAEALVQTRAPRGLAVGDIDGDGALDLLVADNGADAIHVHRGPVCPGDVRPFPAERLALARPQGLALADLDGDGDLDVAACSYAEDTQPVALFENDGAGRFTRRTLEPAGWQAPGEGLAIADLDRDGVPDLVYGALDTGVPSGVLLGRLDSDGRYTVDVTDAARRFPLSDQVLGVDVVDTDGDGWDDVVLARPHHDQVVIHRNRGGRFEAEPDLALPVLAPFTLHAGRDLDLDGHVDIAVASFLSGPLRATHATVLLGPDYQRTWRLPVPAAVSLSAGDLDGDGLDDLLVRSATEGLARAFLLGPGGRDQGRFDLRVVPSHPGAFGAGVGVHAAAAGSSPYSTVPVTGGGLRLTIEDGDLVLTLRDVSGGTRRLALPWDTAPGERCRVFASWGGGDGRLSLSVAPVDGGPGGGGWLQDQRDVHLSVAPFRLGPLAPLLRLGSDPRGAGACAGWAVESLVVNTELPGLSPPER